MKAYTGNNIFSGDWSENLNKDLKIYDTLTAMFKLPPDEKRKGMSVMLTINYFYLFTENACRCNTHEEDKQIWEEWYNNSDNNSLA